MSDLQINKIPLTRIQKIIAKKMLHSKLTKPCFYLEVHSDVTDLMHIRRQAGKDLGVKLTTNTFYIYALSRAAAKYPLVNGVLVNENIVIPSAVNVGFAVTAPQGLVVPVLKSANEKSIATIAEQEKDLTERARDNKLTPADMELQTIALSNLGPFGVDSFIAIVPPDATCIISVGNTPDEVIPVNDVCQVRKILTITAAFDHRIINGVYAARFLRYFADLLEKPNDFL